MRILGLEANGYLIDNPIYLTFAPANADVSHMELSISNLYTGKEIRNVRLYPREDGKCYVDIAPIVKGLFPAPKHNTDYTTNVPIDINELANQITIDVTAYMYESANEHDKQTRTFVRGGVYAINDLSTNLSMTNNRLLSPVQVLPEWNGFPFAYYVYSGGKVKKVNKNASIVGMDVTIKNERIRTCNGSYIKFLNAIGGYSYYLFDTSTESKSNSHLGVTFNANRLTDLGHEVEFDLTVSGKVKSEYMPIISDLAHSKEIYLYLSDQPDPDKRWKRIISKENKIETKSEAKGYTVSVKFEQVKLYNPSLIW